MALKVWLPLNGSPQNQGLMDLQATALGSPVWDVSGKFGICLSTNPNTLGTSNNATGYQYNSNLTQELGKTYSCSIWVKPFGNHVNYNGTFISSGNWNGSCWSFGVNQDNTQVDLFGRGYNKYISCSVPVGKWTHLVCTQKDGITKLYKNGEYVGYASNITAGLTSDASVFTVGRETYANGYFSFNGCINDLRIYDTCLSEEEIRLLSQGLFLHYPLSQNLPMPNIAKTKSLSIYNNYGVPATLTTTGEYYKGAPVYRLTMTPTDKAISSFKTALANQGVYGFSQQWDADTKYSFSIYYKPVTHSDIRVGGTASNKQGWTEITPTSVGDGWYRVGQYRNGTVTTAVTDSIFTSFYTPSAEVGTPISIDFCAPYLVKGITYAPEFDDYNYDIISIEPNSTGLGYDMTFSANQPGVSTNTPRHKLCYDFSVNETTNYLYTTLPAPHADGYANSWSFSWWGKANNLDTKMPWGFNDGNRLNLYTNSEIFCMNTGDGAGNPFLRTDGTSVTYAPYADNNWHHYVVTGNGIQNVLYIDGVQQGIAKSYKGINGTQLFISGWNTAHNYKWPGQLSDLRFYTTPLSADDVLTLYNKSARVNSNAWFAHDYQEASKVDPYNLIYNGKLELGDATNFTLNSGGGWVSDSYGNSNGSLYCPKGYILHNNYIPIDPDSTYKLSFDIKYDAAFTGYQYISLFPYDQFKTHVDHQKVNRYPAADTTLAQDLVNGATTAVLTNGSQWKATSTNNAYRFFGVCDTSYGGYDFARLVKQYTALDGNTITFSSAWSSGTIPAGTKVCNCYAGGVEFYFGHFSDVQGNIPTEWKHYEYTVKGSAIRNYTKYARFAMIWSLNGADMHITNLEFKNITKPQTLEAQSIVGNARIHDTGIVSGHQISEGAMPIRYIRDWCGVNNINNYAHWVEISAYNSAGVNLALGKTATLSWAGNANLAPRVTDGITTIDPYLSSVELTAGNAHSITVDLGFTDFIDTIKIHHYYGDGRTYQNTKTEVSADGVKWYTIFDSKYEGTYAETSAGHTIDVKSATNTVRQDYTFYGQDYIEI